MINTKKRISHFFGTCDSVEQAIRSGAVNFNKRTVQISHQDMPELDFVNIDHKEMTIIAIKHLVDQGVEFKNFTIFDQTIDNTPQKKHSDKILKKQQAIVDMFNEGWIDCKLIAQNLKVRLELVYYTIKYYKFTNRIVAYEKYQCNKIDKVPIIKSYFKENPDCLGNSIKAIKSDLQTKHSTKFGTKLIKRTFSGIGLSYSNWAFMSRKNFDGTGDKLLEREKIIELFTLMDNDVKIYFVDEVKFFSKQLGNRMWANRKLFNEREQKLKTLEIKKREVVVCYSIDGLEGLVIIENGACSTKEFVYLIESILQKDDFDKDSKSVFFLDNASWHGFQKDSDKFSGVR